MKAIRSISALILNEELNNDLLHKILKANRCKTTEVFCKVAKYDFIFLARILYLKGCSDVLTSQT